MGFQTYWQSLKPEQKRTYARRAKTSVGYLALVAGGHRNVGPKLGKRLISASRELAQSSRELRELGLEDIRPDWAQLDS